MKLRTICSNTSRYERQCFSTTRVPKEGGGVTAATVYRKHKTKINNIRKFAAKFLGVGDMPKLSSGSTQVRDMKKQYIIRFLKIKHLVSFIV